MKLTTGWRIFKTKTTLLNLSDTTQKAKRVLVYGNGEQALESALALEDVADKLTFAFR
ncbi:MAG: hypothetical protein ACTSUQ_01025 [Candidatus Freyarchaeota archaeon]